MPITTATELKEFLGRIDQKWSKKIIDSFFNSSPYLKKIKSYADKQGIEFIVYTEMPSFFLNKEEKARETRIPTICFSVLVCLEPERLRKIILLPVSFIILRKKRPGFLAQAVLACLHEIVHVQDNLTLLVEAERKIFCCPYEEGSCLFEELKVGERIRHIAKELKIRIAKKDFFKHLTAGITAPGMHEKCFWALSEGWCLFQERIEKNWLYQKIKAARKTT